jgi:hypothetical protein
LTIGRCARAAGDTLELRCDSGVAKAEVAVFDYEVPPRLQTAGKVSDCDLEGLEGYPVSTGLGVLSTEVTVPKDCHAQDCVIQSGRLSLRGACTYKVEASVLKPTLTSLAIGDIGAAYIYALDVCGREIPAERKHLLPRRTPKGEKTDVVTLPDPVA